MRIASPAALVGVLGALGLLLFIEAPFGPHLSPRQPSGTGTKTQVVATVGTRSITLAEAEQVAALSLHQIEEQRARVLNESIQHLIEEELLTVEAARQGVTVPVLIEQASQSEAIARLANLPAPVRQARRQTGEHAGMPSRPASEDLSRIRQALLVHLRRNTAIHANPLKPELPVLNVSADDDPWTGTVNAPITIIEFSDFECPYCKNSVPVLKEVLAQYPGKVKLVYRDFPGPNHHQALSAAEAAQCAAEQGQFWEYHDALFMNREPGTEWTFSALAKNVGLKPSLFDACMETHRYRDEALKDLQDGLTLGVTSTPTFFINGRPLVGAHPLADFQAIIDKLLSMSTPS